MKKKRLVPPIILYSTRDIQMQAECDCDCDCDCACAPTPASQLSTGVAALWHTAPDLVSLPGPGQYEALFNPSSPVGLALLNPTASLILEKLQTEQSFLQAAAQFTPLDIRKALETLAFLHLIIPQSVPVSEIAPAHMLSAWLHLTDRCNLRCDYCYLPHKREDMSIDTGQAAVESVFRSAQKHGYRRVKLKYAGGEPLLRFSELLEIHARAQFLAESYQIPLDAIVLSNGILLTPQKVSALKAAGLHLMISLDGLDTFHDIQRHFANGKGSAVDVLHGIETALQGGLLPVISVTISSRNADGLPALMEWLLSHGLPFSLNFYRENELSASRESLALQDEIIVGGMRAAFAVIEKGLPVQSLLGSILDRTNLAMAHNKTCGVGSDYLVFDQRGQLAQCQMLINRPFAASNDDDPLEALRNYNQGIQNLPVQQKSGCQSCQWRHWCTGGCPISAQRSSGFYDARSPNCNIYQSLFPDVLRLEAARLIRYQSGKD